MSATATIWRLNDARTGLPVALVIEAFGVRLIFDSACEQCDPDGDETDLAPGLAYGLCCKCDQGTWLWRRRRTP